MQRSRDSQGILAALLVSGMLLGGSVLSKLEAQSEETRHVFEGIVSDAACGVQHKTADAKQCTLACVKNGGGYVLAINDVVYELQGNESEFEKLAGEKVEVSAFLNGKTLNVARITSLEQAS